MVQGTCSTTAKDLQESITLVQCPSDCTVNGKNVWGTGVYTEDSSICKAAIHDGVLNNNGGLVTVKKTAGQASYTGSTRYGVTTNNYGPWSGSFVFPDASKPPASNPTKVPTQKPPVQGTCSTTAKDLQESITLVQCPSDCSVNRKNVWGTGVYTDDSSICKAAIHDGVLSNEGGLVTVKKTAGQASYTGSTRYGVTTNNYGPWSGSFVFPDASKPPATNPTKVPTQKPPVKGTCSITAKDIQGIQGSISMVQCPLNCLVNGQKVWGTYIYTDISSICKAAMHAGILERSGGLVAVKMTPGQSSYSGSTRNGITTTDYGSWSGSFIFQNP
ncbi:cysteine-rich secretory protein LCCL domain-containing 2-like [Mantella aurantiaca]